MPGRGDVKQLSAWVLIQAGNCREQQSLWHTGLLEEQGQFSMEETVRRNTVSVAQKVCWEEHNLFITEIFLLVFFHSTEQCALGWSDTLVLIFWEGKKDCQWKQLSCNVSCC